MVEPVLLSIVFGYFSAHAQDWLKALKETALGAGKDLAKQHWSDFLNEKQQQRHIELALKNATVRGLMPFQTLEERDQYRYILKILAEPGSHSDALRREALQLFTLFGTPDLTELNEAYNRSLRIRSLTQPTPPSTVDAGPYLKSFFDALLAELYQDTFFRPQMSDMIRTRAAHCLQTVLPDILAMLHQIHEVFSDDYSPEQFEKEVAIYASHVERSFRYLKLAGVVPQNFEGGYRDPELVSIFVPLRVASQQNATNIQDDQDTILSILQTYSYVVLLGGPGSGKSTISRYLAWSHANKHLSHDTSQTMNIPLLAGHPLPLRIELRLLTEARLSHQEYDLLAYVTNVLLGGTGVHVDRRLFERLLEQRGMLVLFDGLDEVPTLKDRRRIIEDIENFVQDYPGNPVLVTSRLVGYPLAPCPEQWFTRAYVLPLNNEQIHEFLERWYTYVLRTSPLLPADQQEMESLITALNKNLQLHALAETPLLLSVIAALHRYERLPDRRVLVYDRCVDLLLGKWAQLKGTDERWQALQIRTEDLYACIAHIGFTLHQRSQESKHAQDSDVSLRELLKEWENYFQHRHFFASLSEGRMQAKLLLELVQVEAGLIVERGTDEQGEVLYGFIHRSFQEYLAAIDVYERYLESEDTFVIRQFLIEHLHDPHWRECILLLLAKLKRGPASNQLGAILDGTLQSNRSSHTELIQQDLSFLCSCLVEGIVVGIPLAERIIARVCNVVNASPFLSQRVEAIQALISLLKTREYSRLAYTAFESLTRRDVLADALMRGMILFALYLNNLASSQERQKLGMMLASLIQEPNLPVKEFVEVALTFYQACPDKHTERHSKIWISEGDPVAKLFSAANAFDKSESALKQELVAQLLSNLTQRVDISIEELLASAAGLYRVSLHDSEEQRLAVQILLRLTQQLDLSTEDFFEIHGILYKNKRIWGDAGEPTQMRQILLNLKGADYLIERLDKVASTLYKLGPNDSEEQKLAKQAVFDLTQRVYRSIEEFVEVASVLYEVGSNESEKQKLTRRMLTHILQQGMFVHDLILAVHALRTSKSSEIQTSAWQMLSNLANWADLADDAFNNLAITLYVSDSPTREQAKQMLLNLVQQMAIPYMLYRHTALLRKANNPAVLELKIPLLLSLMQRDVLTIEERINIASNLYTESSDGSEEQKQAKQVLLAIAQRNDLSVREFIEITSALHELSLNGSDEEAIIRPLLLDLTQRTGLTIEQIVNDMLTLCLDHAIDPELGYQVLLDLTQQGNLSLDQFIDVAHALLYLGIDEAFNLGYLMLLNLFQMDRLSTEQSFKAAYVICTCIHDSSAMQQWAEQTISTLYQQNDLPIDEDIKISCNLYQRNMEAEKRELAKQMMLGLFQRSDLSLDQSIQALQALYNYNPDGSSEEWKLAVQLLWDLLLKPKITPDQQLQVSKAVLTWWYIPYAVMVQAISTIRSMLSTEQAREYLYWRLPYIGFRQDHPSDIPYLVELAQSELLSPNIRDTVYQRLRDMIAYFHSSNIR